jgi:type VI secretion system secreted protein VgrG
VVDFLNGDPDRPIVVGSVYNGDKKPAYPLADNKTMSVWRSHTIDGGADDYNEISFEDKNGDEVFNVQAQKDRKTLVKHDDTKTIKNNLTTTVQEGDEKREVSQGKRTTTVQQNEELTVNAGDMKTTVSAGNYTIDISAGQMTVTAAISIELKVGSSSVKLDQTGVTIKGMMISSEAQVQLSEKAVMIQISADALLQAKGAITMIN